MRHNGRGEDATHLGEGEGIKETSKAVLIRLIDRGDELWIPKSVIHDDSEVYEYGQTGEVYVKQWWAENNGL